MAKIKSNKRITKKEVIKEEAAKLFHDRGYGAASMRDLAEVLGVEAPSLYNHIKSKEELLQEICFSTANEFSFQIGLVENNDKLSAIQKIESITRFHIHIWVDKLNDVLVMTNEAKHLSEPYLTTFLNERKLYVKRFEAIVTEGIRKGQLKKLDAYVVVLTILNAVRGIEFWHRSQKNTDASQLEEHMVSSLLTGLKK